MNKEMLNANWGNNNATIGGAVSQRYGKSLIPPTRNFGCKDCNHTFKTTLPNYSQVIPAVTFRIS